MRLACIMRFGLVSAMGCCALAAVGVAQEAPKQLGPHEHGHAFLDLAVQDHQFVLELKVPGADIVGSKVKPETPEAKMAQAAAIAKLQNPLELFRFRDAATCEVVGAKAAVVADDDGDGHSNFQANYNLTCAAPTKATSLQVDFFRAFPRSQKMTIQVVTAKGQAKIEATPAKPKIVLAGVM